MDDKKKAGPSGRGGLHVGWVFLVIAEAIVIALFVWKTLRK